MLWPDFILYSVSRCARNIHVESRRLLTAACFMARTPIGSSLLTFLVGVTPRNDCHGFESIVCHKNFVCLFGGGGGGGGGGCVCVYVCVVWFWFWFWCVVWF